MSDRQELTQESFNKAMEEGLGIFTLQLRVAFEVLEWATNRQRGVYTADGIVLEQRKQLTPVETGTYNAALERLQVFLRQDVPSGRKTLPEGVIPVLMVDHDTYRSYEEIPTDVGAAMQKPNDGNGAILGSKAIR